MIDVKEYILNHKVLSVNHNYKISHMTIRFDNGYTLIFKGCAIVFDLEIIGHLIIYVSNTGTLGLTFELKSNNEDPDNYKFLILSRDINDYENKNEMAIAYKDLTITRDGNVSN